MPGMQAMHDYTICRDYMACCVGLNAHREQQLLEVQQLPVGKVSTGGWYMSGAL